MAKNVNANEKKSVKIDGSAFTKNAKHIADVTEKWVGMAPGAIQTGLTSNDLPEVSIDDMVSRNITVLGFQERKGIVKGKPTEYVIALVVIEGDSTVYSCMTGASVFVRKLREAGDAEAFPVTGTITKPEGKNYFNFVA